MRFSDLVMRDHQTESLWQQATGEAIVGDLTGKRLTFIPATVVSWTDFKAAFPQGKVFSKDTGFSRSYGRNPYSGYDNSERPFLFSGEVDERLGGLERVVPVTAGEADVAYPFSVISRLMVVHDRVGDREVVVFHQGGTASAQDGGIISATRDVGAASGTGRWGAPGISWARQRGGRFRGRF